ncbi:ABEC1 enzyme, partial [Chloropsis cyanopogon]|nr:ABEC1 enzyme [Chloropsis cyanopogon]
SMYISKKALRKHFDPREYPRETYLLCELHWGESPRFWQHWVRNDSCNNYHAEKCFLEEIFEPRSYNICHMSWYLSWSPCADCCDVIRDFLEKHPNVIIDIRVVRPYYRNIKKNCSALRELKKLPRVNYLASVSPDYNYCWETFIQPGVNYHFSPKKFEPEIQRNHLRLEDMLQVSTL